MFGGLAPSRVDLDESQIGATLSFGPFTLSPSERRLEKNGVFHDIGSRAFEILLILLERPGELVTKQDLLSRVWPDIFIEESSLRVHVANLRKSLGDDGRDVRYITNVPGRGYCFVATVRKAFGGAVEHPEPKAQEHRANDLPLGLNRMIGRDDDVVSIARSLIERRFVTIVGPGGMGKTSVGLAVARAAAGGFKDGVVFFDLSQISEGRLVASTLSSMLGVSVHSSEVLPILQSHLANRACLIVLDCCEHVVGAAAQLAEELIVACPRVNILATSREALRAEGEYVYTLEPLRVPVLDHDSSSDNILRFPAAQLLVERITTHGTAVEICEETAKQIAEICNRLDGIPLAIELASSGIGNLGLGGMVEVLDNRLHMGFQGRRTALPRHQTLQALLDWSYNLLPPTEQLVLQRLAIFVGPFSLDAAQAVATCADLDDGMVIDAVFNLVSKSLISNATADASPRFRLLDTTRAYALNKLIQSEAHHQTARAHRDYLTRRLRTINLSPHAVRDHNPTRFQGEDLGEVRSALDWSFDREGNPKSGLALSAAATGLFIELSLLSECGDWTTRSLDLIDESTIGTEVEMQLQAASGISCMFVRGNTQQAQDALIRGLSLASALNQPHYQLQLLGVLNIFYCRLCNYSAALEIAKRSSEIADRLNTPLARAISAGMIGTAHHLGGDQSSSQASFDAALLEPSTKSRLNTLRVGYDHRLRDMIFLARTLWLRGSPRRGCDLALEAIAEAAEMDHSVSNCITLVYAIPMFIWHGDTATAASLTEQLIAYADKHSLRPYVAAGLGLKGQLAVIDGRPREGLNLLRRAIVTLEMERYHILASVFFGALSSALTAIGGTAEAAEMIGRAVARDASSGDVVSIYTAELLRVKGDVLAACEGHDPQEVIACYRRAISIAKEQTALGWELRAVLSLHAYCSDVDGLDTLDHIRVLCDRYEEDSDTVDLALARAHLAKALDLSERLPA
ncbi:ATP-binding protein [Rhizobium leguminosarum]|uniref:ATP-binding protein n=1 Tax=Rhizobium leguminosarum TaxID=384 RepID=UPI003F95483D